MFSKHQNHKRLLVLLHSLLHLLHAREDSLRSTRTLRSQNHLDRLTERHVAEEVQARLRIISRFIHHHGHIRVVLSTKTTMKHSTNQCKGSEGKLRDNDSVVATRGETLPILLASEHSEEKHHRHGENHSGSKRHSGHFLLQRLHND